MARRPGTSSKSVLVAKKSRKSLQGHFLIAAPELADPNFRQTIVLMIQHSKEGALGLVINRPTSVQVKQGWAQVSEQPCATEEHLYVGGPCEGLLMAVHQSAEHGEIQVLPEVHFSAQPEHIEQLVRLTDGPMRFFVGYAGWGPGQLEQEMKQKSWLVLPARPEWVFAVEFDLWNKLRGQVSADALIAEMKIANRPNDPTVN